MSERAAVRSGLACFSASIVSHRAAVTSERSSVRRARSVHRPSHRLAEERACDEWLASVVDWLLRLASYDPAMTAALAGRLDREFEAGYGFICSGRKPAAQPPPDLACRRILGSLSSSSALSLLHSRCSLRLHTATGDHGITREHRRPLPIRRQTQPTPPLVKHRPYPSLASRGRTRTLTRTVTPRHSSSSSRSPSAEAQRHGRRRPRTSRNTP